MEIDELYNQIYNDKASRNPSDFINTYSSHKFLIDTTSIENNKDNYQKIMRMNADYAHNLVIKEKYDEALPEIEKSINLFKNYPGFQDKNLLEVSFYETLLFDRAVINYYLKNFNTTIKDLKVLKEYSPENQTYKNWLSAAKSYKNKKFIKLLWYIIIATAITNFISETLEFRLVSEIFLYLGVFTLLVVGIAELIILSKKKKINTKG